MEQCCLLVTIYEYFLVLVRFSIFFSVACNVTVYCDPVSQLACWQLWCQVAQPRDKQCDAHTLVIMSCFHQTAHSYLLQEHWGCYSSPLLMLFTSISVLHLCDGCRCCCQCVRKCRKALMTKCPRPCLWLLEAGLIDALMPGADVSMLKCSQRCGVCGVAWLSLTRATAARVSTATVWLRAL